jgi:centromeric protein E
MVIESRSKGAAVRVGAIHLVDLAGSERLKSTQAEGVRAKEGVQINKSLLTLGLVIRKLSTAHGSLEHVPYRDSMLTRILQPALGGNSKTAIICNISPAVQNADESLSTLKFASQAKLVTNVVSVNEIVDEHALLQRYKAQIEDMAGELQRLRTGSDVRDLEAQLAQKEDELSRMRSLIVTSKSMHSAAANRLLHRETWCAGLDGPSALSMSMVGERGAKTVDLANCAKAGDEGLQELLLAGSENAATPHKQHKKKIPKTKSVPAGPSEEEERLRARLKQIEGELQDAKEMQEALEEDNRSLDRRVKELSLRSEGGQHEASEARERIAFLVETLQMSEEQLVELRREAELNRAKAQQWEVTRVEAEEECERLRVKLAEQATLEDKAMRAEELELEVTALKWEQSKSSETIANLEARLNAESAARAALEARLAEAEELEHEAEAARVEREAGLAAEKQTLAESMQHAALLQAKVVEAGEQLAERSAELRRVTEERDALQERLRVSASTLQQETMATESQMAGLQSQLRSVASVREKIRALSGETAATAEDETKARLEKTISENASLRQALAEAQARADALAELDGELDERRLSNATRREAQQKWEVRVEQMRVEAAAESDKARRRIECLEREVTQMEEEVLILEREVARLKDADKRTQAERKNDAATIGQLKSELEAAKGDKSARTELEQARRSAKEELRVAVQREKEATNVLREELERTKKNSGATAKMLEQARAAKEQAEREARLFKAQVQEQSEKEAREREQRLAMHKDLIEAKASLEAKDKEQSELRELHAVELAKKDKKLVQLKELAMEKAKEKLKERDAMIVRLKKEKLRISQNRDEEVEALVRQQRAETEELQKQIAAKTEALALMRGIVEELQVADENGGGSSEAPGKQQPRVKKETLLKLHNNFA